VTNVDVVDLQSNQERLPVAEMQAAEDSGQFTYVPPAPVTGDDADSPGVNTDRTTSGIGDEDAPVSPSSAPETDQVKQKMVGVLIRQL